MTGIDNLKNRIINDGKVQNEKVEVEAYTKSEDILKTARKNIEKMLIDAKNKAVIDGTNLEDRIISSAKLESRNMRLAAKQEAIDNVFKATLDRIYSMGKSEYSNFLETIIVKNVEIGDEEVIFSQNDKQRLDSELIDRVNKKLVLLNKKGKLVYSTENREIKSGFILKKGRIEIDCSIESLVWSFRESLESEIANLLFEDR